MTKVDLKPGYVVETRDGHLGLIVNSDSDRLIVAYFNADYRAGFDPVSYYHDNLCLTSAADDDCDIVKVYGYPSRDRHFLDWHRSMQYRPLLWERPAAKKMTVKEICDALGYEVEIVKDGADE